MSNLQNLPLIIDHFLMNDPHPFPDHPIILFDGVCNLCNTAVQWVLTRDHKAQFRFAALQSEIGQRLLAHFGLAGERFDTVVLIDDDRIYTRSDAALTVAGRLGGAWRLMRVFLWVPLPIRNAVYDWVGRNRYRWFGKKAVCWMPTADLKARFVG